jgi:uncharacterized protein YraI
MRRMTTPASIRRPSRDRRLGGRPLLVALFGLACVASTLLPPAGIALAKSGTATKKLVIRAAPDDHAAILLHVPADATITIKGRSRQGYYPVSYAALEGWVATGYLASSDTDNSGDERNDQTTTIVALDDLNMRSRPTPDSDVLLTVPKGDAVTLSGQQTDGFVAVTYQGTDGWVEGDELAAVQARVSRNPRDFSQAEIIQAIYDAADRYGQPREDMLRVARCESDLVPTAVNKKGGSYGLFQFKPGTWLSTPYADYDIFDPRASAYAAGWMWSQGRRREWVCQ